MLQYTRILLSEQSPTRMLGKWGSVFHNITTCLSESTIRKLNITSYFRIQYHTLTSDLKSDVLTIFQFHTTFHSDSKIWTVRFYLYLRIRKQLHNLDCNIFFNCIPTFFSDLKIWKLSLNTYLTIRHSLYIRDSKIRLMILHFQV